MSFDFSGIIREGSWRIFREFVLQEFRDVPKRILAIDAELARIGRITVIHAVEEADPGRFRATEARRGIVVTPGSTLQKFLQSYIAVGGNPFDISLFSMPDETVSLTINGEQQIVESAPYGGIGVPLGVDVAEDGPYDAGFLPYAKYLPRRLGGREIVWNTTAELVDSTNRMRRWITQEIREKRNDLEYRIIRLCDLRERLLIERNEWIAGAVGPTVAGSGFIERYHAESARVQALIYTIDANFYTPTDSGRLDMNLEDPIGRAFTRFRTLLSNLPVEKWTAL